MQTKEWNSVAPTVNFNLEISIANFKNLVQKDTAILDYGCGYGRNCEILYKEGYSNVVGIDSSPEMIKRGNLEYPHLSLHHSNDLKLNYPNGHFGAIILCAVLTCIPKNQTKVNILSEINKLLCNKGILHIVEFCNERGKTFKSKLGIVMNYQKPSEIRSLVKEYTELNFEIFQTQTMSGKKVEAISYLGQKIT